MWRNKNRKLILAITGAMGIPGGIAKANFNVIKAVADLTSQKGYQMKVLSYLENQQHRPSILPDNVPFIPFGGNKRRYIFSLLSELPGSKIFIFDHVTLALPLLIPASLGLAKTVVFAHGSEAWKRIRWSSILSFRVASLCLTNSNFTLSKMKERLGPFHGIACPLGLSPEFHLNDVLPTDKQEPIQKVACDGKEYFLGSRFFFMAARMHPKEGGEKGHQYLIEILPLIHKKYPDVQLVFAGPGEDRPRLEKLALALGVGHAVFFVGFVSVEELKKLYLSCFAYVMPSKQEGFGMAYLEAMNYGKACIGCYDQGAEDIIVHDKTGYLLRDPGNRDELLRVLMKLLSDPQKTQKMGENGFVRLHERFTARDYQSRIQDALKPLL